MNQEIRLLIQENHLKYWQVAFKVGIADTTFSKWLRMPLDAEHKARVEKAIAELTQTVTK